MTNEQVRQGFTEVYNEFWNRYKNHEPVRNSQEWERIRTWSVVLQKKYPFLKETIIQLELELDRRMRRKLDEAERYTRNDGGAAGQGHEPGGHDD